MAPRCRLLGIRQSSVALILGAILPLCGLVPIWAQTTPAGAGSISGTITNLYSKPLTGLLIVLRNPSTGQELHVLSGRGGSYRFPAVPAGSYTLLANDAANGVARIEDLEIANGHESRVQVALALVPADGVAAPGKASEPDQSAPEAESPDPFAAEKLHFRQESPKLAPATATTQKSLAVVPPVRTSGALAEIPMPCTIEDFSSGRCSLADDTPDPSQKKRTRKASVAPPLAETMAQRAAILSAFAHEAAKAMGTATRKHRVDDEAAAPAPQVTDPAAQANTTTIDGASLKNQPGSATHLRSFLLDTPAASSASESSSATTLRASELPAENLVDGSPRTTAFTAQAPAVDPEDAANSETAADGNSAAWGGRDRAPLTPAAIRSASVTSANASSEVGRSAGGAMDAESESGQLVTHGQLFVFSRQSGLLGARDPYTNWLKNTGTAEAPVFTATPWSPDDRSLTMGFGLGGTFKRPHLSWYTALDHLSRNHPAVSQVRNPANFFNLLGQTNEKITLLSARLGEDATAAYNDYLGNSTGSTQPAGLETLAGLLGPAARTTEQWNGFGRLDFQAVERHHITLEGIGAHWDAPGGSVARTGVNFGTHSLGHSLASESWLLARWEFFLTPNLLATTQLSGGRQIHGMRPSTPSTLEKSFLSGNLWNQLPQINVDPYYGFTIGNPARFGSGSYPDEISARVSEQVDAIFGKLHLKAGFSVDHFQDATTFLRNHTGTYQYSSAYKFISDALVFEKYGLTDPLDPTDPHNCDAPGTGRGALPCYSWYSQTLGPTDWLLSTNDWAGYLSAQWQPRKNLVLSAGIRTEQQELPPPFSYAANSDLPLTSRNPQMGIELEPRFSLAWGTGRQFSPILRLGYGLYGARTSNLRLMAVMTQTGGTGADHYFFLRPVDDMPDRGGGAPPFPYVLTGTPGSEIKPSAVEFASNFRNPQVQQAVLSVEQPLPWRMHLVASGQLSLGRRLPVSIDTNFDSTTNPGSITYKIVDKSGKGPLSGTLTVPLYASWLTAAGDFVGRANSNYQQIDQLQSRANSTWEAGSLTLLRSSTRGLTFRSHLTYAHASDWNPDESARMIGSSMLDPANFRAEYGPSNLDQRLAATTTLAWRSGWHLNGFAPLTVLANDWSLAATGHYRTGLPYSMRSSGSLAQFYLPTLSTSIPITALATGMNGSGGDNRIYGLPRNGYRYPDRWKADVRLTKRFELGSLGRLELMLESFNLLNHQNVIAIETTGYTIESGPTDGTDATLNYLMQGTSGDAATTPAFGRPYSSSSTDYYQPRLLQFGLRLRFLVAAE